jgi:hypothetical protein
MSLGENRALAVRDYLIRLGISGDRIQTRSYGEEKPAVAGTGEEVWRLNRRASSLCSRSSRCGAVGGCRGMLFLPNVAFLTGSVGTGEWIVLFRGHPHRGRSETAAGGGPQDRPDDEMFRRAATSSRTS